MLKQKRILYRWSRLQHWWITASKLHSNRICLHLAWTLLLNTPIQWFMSCNFFYRLSFIHCECVRLVERGLFNLTSFACVNNTQRNHMKLHQFFIVTFVLDFSNRSIFAMWFTLAPWILFRLFPLRVGFHEGVALILLVKCFVDLNSGSPCSCFFF